MCQYFSRMFYFFLPIIYCALCKKVLYFKL
nr:MAG TPA: hypothetical protein [Bacteriophage sp.]